LDFGHTHRNIAPVDIVALLDALSGVGEKDWDADEALRAKLAPYRQTRSIFLYFALLQQLPLDRRATQADIARRAGWEAFSSVVQPIMDAILRHYPPGGVVVRCQLAMLQPHGSIPPHRDTSPLLRLSHRIHLPLITNPKVRFIIGGSEHNFEPGVAFELNNQRVHSVDNGGRTSRTHLIFDYLPADYREKAAALLARKSRLDFPISRRTEG
jgi:hypothetical protein